MHRQIRYIDEISSVQTGIFTGALRAAGADKVAGLVKSGLAITPHLSLIHI